MAAPALRPMDTASWTMIDHVADTAIGSLRTIRQQQTPSFLRSTNCSPCSALPAPDGAAAAAGRHSR